MHALSRALICTLMLAAPLVSASAQQDTTAAAAPVFGWRHSMLAGFVLSQASYTDWAAGGENSLAYTGSLDGKATDSLEATNWETTYQFHFGQSRLGSQGLRKTEDKIDISSVLTFNVWDEINPYAAATFRSQFTTGYDYDDLGGRTAVSAFFDPAYLTPTAGFEYKPGPVIKTRLGAGFRGVFTSNYPLYADDPETAEVETTLFEAILESVTDLTWTIDEGITFTSKLEITAPFKTIDKLYVRSDNILAAQINEYLTAKVNVELVNDWRVTARTQVRETVAFGLSYALL